MVGGGDPVATLDLAYYEVTKVALRAWGYAPAAGRLVERVASVDADGDWFASTHG